MCTSDHELWLSVGEKIVKRAYGLDQVGDHEACEIPLNMACPDHMAWGIPLNLDNTKLIDPP